MVKENLLTRYEHHFNIWVAEEEYLLSSLVSSYVLLAGGGDYDHTSQQQFKLCQCDFIFLFILRNKTVKLPGMISFITNLELTINLCLCTVQFTTVWYRSVKEVMVCKSNICGESC